VVRLALRSLARTPAFAAAVVVTLTAAMAANAAFFAGVDKLILRPLPYRDAGRLAVIFETQPGTRTRALVSPPDFLSLQGASRTLAGVAAYRRWGFVLATPGGAERIIGARVTANLLPVLGVQPALGRGFLDEEDVFGGAHVVIVSHAFWRQRLGSPADLTARVIVLGGVAHAVVGVLPPEFRLPAADVLVPMALEPFALTQRGNRALTVIARLSGDVSLAAARAELDTIAQDLGRRFPEANGGWGAGAIPLEQEVRGRYQAPLLMLWGSIGLVLLIACVNTSGLMLARVAARRQQIAVCRALGAGRRRIMGELLGESAILAVVAALLSVPLAQAVLAALVRIVPPDLSRLADARIDLRVTLFSLAVAVAAAAAIGLPAAMRGSRDDLSPLLRTGRWGGAADATLRRAALAGQIALAVIVVLGSSLLVRSLRQVLAVDPGFDPSHVLTMTLAPDAKYGDPSQRVAFFDLVMQRAEAVAGVEAAGISSHPPLAGGPLVADVFTAPPSAARRAPDAIANLSAVGGNWFAAMRIPLRAGRAFGRQDAAGRPAVVVISDNLAQRLWPGEPATGRRLFVGGSLGSDPGPREVIGVVGNVRTNLGADAPLQVYVPYAQNAWPTIGVAVRTAGDPQASAGAVREAIRRIDTSQAVYDFASLDQIAARAVAPRRFQAIVVSLFALFAILLAAMGAHAVMAYAVRQRTAEFGVRLALGASRRSVVLLALGEVLRPAVVGVAIGSCLALPAVRAMRALLFSVRPTDPVSFAVALGVVGTIVLVASLSSGLRASRIDAVKTLRDG
jgi:putative ABC transport system permease protein